MQLSTPGLEYALINDDKEYRVSQGTAVRDATLEAILSKNKVEIIIPEYWKGKQVTTIGEFGYCESLFSVSIPTSVKSIDMYAFVDCISLENVTIPDDVSIIESSTFSGCSSLLNITIPDKVTAIGSNAFRGCKSLEVITIPASVTSIGTYAFYDCSRLKVLNFKPKIAPEVPDGDFSYLPYGCSVHIPSDGQGYDIYPWNLHMLARSIKKDL